MLDGSTTNWAKGMHKASWTSTQKKMEYDGMSREHVKPRWKTLMIFNDAIYVQVKEGGEDGNVEGISTP
jgi:hypothetical protein